MAFDAFLELYDSGNSMLKAESDDHAHKECIQVKSFSLGVEHPCEGGLGTGMASGKTKFQEAEFEVLQSKASPTLLLWAACGEHLQKAVLYIRKAGSKQQDYTLVTMSELFVTKFNISASDGAESMVEKLSLAFTGIQYEYHQQDQKGVVSKTAHKAGWHVKKNDKWSA